MIIYNMSKSSNEKCNCGSGKKYKVCCLLKEEEEKHQEYQKYYNGHEVSSTNVAESMVMFLEKYPKFNVIDITNYLTKENYKKFLLMNMKFNTIMFAERTATTEELFLAQTPLDMPVDTPINMMIIYKGAYRIYHSSVLKNVENSLDEMILNRMKGLNDVPVKQTNKPVMKKVTKQLKPMKPQGFNSV